MGGAKEIFEGFLSIFLRDLGRMTITTQYDRNCKLYSLSTECWALYDAFKLLLISYYTPLRVYRGQEMLLHYLFGGTLKYLSTSSGVNTSICTTSA